ncbi:uncharacterized protein TM35_000361510 [Trypanosoma theileri]|uniref:Uncharacterized protein n=1 Tax=Trypanosoma theileri TaxID=67003 RepID=A0A1X0NL39_9TRYP|nr:uncharacterized protein TM35_000361510 [Trypanosoma theileri]ORC85291.1 hypothetical protein TM35_000361510 [Trypanosoma theileri]
MGGNASTEASVGSPLSDADSTAQQQQQKEDAEKRRRYAHLTSAAAQHQQKGSSYRNNNNSNSNSGGTHHKNIIETVYDEDFDTIDHMQAVRFPPMVVKQLQDAVDSEAERRCADAEKTMARCLQDKMWTSWKCQKERDRYYHCAAKERENPSRLMEYRWKYNLGTFHGEIIGRNNMMRRVWAEHFPERELPHPWVKDQ